MIDVLVVDDKVADGRSFTQLIEAETGLKAMFTPDPKRAEEIVRAGQIKVAVLDLVLEGTETSGTKLFRKLRELDADVRGILFTGQYQAEDVIEALDVDFVTVLDKGKVAELSERVLAIYSEYLGDLARRVADTPPAKEVVKRRFAARGRTVKYEVLAVRRSTFEARDEIVLDDRYVPILKLNVGQTKETHAEAGHTTEVIIEGESSTKLSLGATAEVRALAKLESAVESVVRIREERRDKTNVTVGEREIYTLPPDQGKGEGRSIRARHIERAPVYVRERAVIRITCGCCGISRVEPVNVLVPTGAFRERHHDFFSDNTDEYVKTD